jgi:hypothetical protein
MIAALNRYFHNPSRNQFTDLLKGVAIVDMIMGHILDLFILQVFYEQVSYYFRILPAAPLFTAVMGYYIFLSRKNLEQQIVRGVKLIAWGLLLNIGLNFHLLIKIYSGELLLNPYHYLFGADILTFAGLSIIIISAIKHFFQKKLFVYIFLSFAAVLIHNYLPSVAEDSLFAYVQAFFWGSFEWSYFPIFPWLFYPLIGFAAGIILENHQEVIEKYLVHAFAASFLFVILTFDYALTVAADYKEFYHHDIFFAVRTLLFLTFFVTLFYFVERFFSKNFFTLYLKWIGKNVTAFYVFQWLIIGNIATAIYKTQHLQWLAVWFLGILILVSLLVFIYNELKKKAKAETQLKKA